MSENTLDKILTGIEALQQNFGNLQADFKGLQTGVNGLETGFGGLQTNFNGLQTRFHKLELNQDKLLAKVINIEFRLDDFVTTDKLRDVLSETNTKIDGFIKFHTIIDTEFLALRSKQERMDERLMKVEKKVGINPA